MNYTVSMTTPMEKALKKCTTEFGVELVKALADILDEAGLAELEYETADLSIRMSRVSGAAPVAPVTAVAALAATPAAAPAATAARRFEQTG